MFNTLLYPSSCPCCKSSLESLTVMYSNPNGNAGRPYLKCSKPLCNKFVTFTDNRGIHDDDSSYITNPLCQCGSPSRLQVCGREPHVRNPRALHFVCAYGRCEFFEYKFDSDGEKMILSEFGIGEAAIDGWI